MGRTENGCVDLMLHDFLLHVLKIHPPDIIFVHIHGRMDNVVAIVFQSMGEAHISGRMDQDVITLGAHHIQRADHAAQNAVGVADVLGFQTLHTVALLLPVDNGIVILITGPEIAVDGMLRALDDRFRDRGCRGKIHVRDPHGDQVKTFLRLSRRKIHCQSILAVTVQDGSKIVFHNLSP